MSSPVESELRRLGLELLEIERAQGIDKQAGRAREGPFLPLHAFSKTPFGTMESRLEFQEELSDEAETIRWRIRTLYFSVPDAEARRQIIGKLRQIESLHRSEAREEERMAERAVGAAMEATAHGAGHLAIEFAAFAVVAWLDGWIAGIFVSFIAWWILKPTAEKAKRARIAQAERDADLARDGTAKTLAWISTFSELEEHTGDNEERRGRIG